MNPHFVQPVLTKRMKNIPIFNLVFLHASGDATEKAVHDVVLKTLISNLFITPKIWSGRSNSVLIAIITSCNIPMTDYIVVPEGNEM